MFLPPTWQHIFSLYLASLKITSKEQTVSTERQGPGGREEVGLISGIFQFPMTGARASDVLLVPWRCVEPGCYTCVRWGGGGGGGVVQGWDQCESAMKEPAKLFFASLCRDIVSAAFVWNVISLARSDVPCALGLYMCRSHRSSYTWHASYERLQAGSVVLLNGMD